MGRKQQAGEKGKGTVTSRRLPDHMVFYSGPSVLDGNPIIAVAYGFNRANNSKLGHVIEISFFVADAKPSEAAASGCDRAVCGDCPGRPSYWGYCYVQIAKEVNKTWEAARSLKPDPAAVCELIHVSGLPLRIGVYGDGAAVPFEVLETLVLAARAADGKWRHTGFTHQWSHPNFDPRVLKYLHASVEFPEERAELKRLFPNAHTYRNVQSAAVDMTGELKCNGGPKVTDDHCCDCLSCCGGAGPAGADRFVVVHGADKIRNAFRKYQTNPLKNTRHVHQRVLERLPGMQDSNGGMEEHMLATATGCPPAEAPSLFTNNDRGNSSPTAPLALVGGERPPEHGTLGLDTREGSPPRRTRAGTRFEDSAWRTHQETCGYLQVEARTLVARMRETPPHIERPWINYGTPTRPFYRWRSSGVDRWWIEVNEWRTSRDEGRPAASAGPTRTGRRGAGSARTSRPPASSSSRSSAPSPRDGAGSLVTLVRSLTSKTS